MLNELAQLAAIDQANKSGEDRTSIDIERTIRNSGGIYFDCAFQDVGALATPVCAVIVQAIIAVKRIVWPGRSRRIFVFIDEAQMFPREFLKQLIEQAAGSGVILVLAYHTLDQMGDDVETISMTQARMIFGAVPGGSTDRHLQCLFGTHIVYRRNYSNAAGVSASESVTNTYGPVGDSLSISNGLARTQQSSFGFTEVDESVWTPNDTLKLNDNRDHFVLQVSPGAEFAQYGPSAILAHRGGTHLTFDKINRLTEDALNNTPDTYLPNAPRVEQIEAPQFPPQLAEKRASWLAILNKAAERIRSEIN